MTLTVDFWQLVGLGLTLIGAFFTLGKLLIAQTLAGLDKRMGGISETLRKIEDAQGKAADKLNAVERDLLVFKADANRDFVRRDDHVRDLATVRMSIDQLGLKIDTAILRGSAKP